MKILMINKFFYRKGGSEAYLFDLRALLQKAGHQVIEFSMQDKKNEPSEWADYFIKNIDFNQRQGWLNDLKKAGHLLYSFEAKRKIEALIKKEKPDIAHLHNFNFQLTPAILGVLKKYNIPVVWTLHDYHLICPNYRLFTQGAVCARCKTSKFYNCYKYKCLKNSRAMSFLAMLEMYLHKIILKSYSQIDLFIAPSKFMAETVKEWGIKPERVIQLNYFINPLNSLPEQLSTEGLLYFGRLSEEKGLLILLAAMKELPEISLKIVGSGPQKKELEQYIEANNLNNVQLFGYKQEVELSDLIKKARLVILPAIWLENYPVSILEAQALAKPVIGSNLGGIPELVIEDKTGFLFPAGLVSDLKNTIKNNYDNLEKLQALGQNAKIQVESIASPANHLQAIMAIYNKLITKYE